MPEVEGHIRRFNNTGFEVVVGITRLRCTMNMWQNIHRNYKVGDYVAASYTQEEPGDTKVLKAMVKREDLNA